MFAIKLNNEIVGKLLLDKKNKTRWVVLCVINFISNRIYITPMIIFILQHNLLCVISCIYK